MNYRTSSPIVIGNGIPSRSVRERFIGNKKIEAFIEKDNISFLIEDAKIKINLYENNRERYNIKYGEEYPIEKLRAHLKKLCAEKRTVIQEIRYLEMHE